MFCSPRTSKLTLAETGTRAGGACPLASFARDALALARAFLLLEDGDPVDWEVGEEELAAASEEGRRLHEPAWAPAHRASQRVLRAPRRGGQPVAPPQVCLCPKGPSDPQRNIFPYFPYASTFSRLNAEPQNRKICRAFVKSSERSAAFYAEPPSRA